MTIFTRFYDLGTRVMSHDESLHTYYSFQLYRGRGFEHTPLMHGPFQFHAIALSYFLFGDSDFSARIPAVLASIAMIGFMWQYRRYLGRAGAIITAVLLVISPYMLYYGRYVRNEAYAGLFGVITIWAILRYLDKGDARYLYFLTTATALHFAVKETSFIYTAQAMLFLGLLFIRRVSQQSWERPNYKRLFLIVLIVTFVFLGFGGGIFLVNRNAEALSATEIAAPADPDQELSDDGTTLGIGLPIYFLIFSLIATLGSLFFLFRGYTLKRLRQERTFDLILLLGTQVLPMLAPFPIRLLGGNPLDYAPSGIARSVTVFVPMALIAIGIGLLWNWRVWLINAAIFYSIFAVLFTTVFTNGLGLATGLVGSLGYWLEQQGVRRGSQPWYYYLVVQIPVYEYLPAIGSLLALFLAARQWLRRKATPPSTKFTLSGAERLRACPEHGGVTEGVGVPIALIGFWTITSVFAYTLAGEKMPWLTFHIALPMILLTGWALGQLVERVDWDAFQTRRGWVIIALLLVFFPGLVATFLALLGPNPPFQGQELVQLQTTITFLTALITTALSSWGLYRLLKPWGGAQIVRVAGLTVFTLLGLLTARAAFVASYINYDNATEYLVYAHAATGVKDVLAQAEEISRRTDGALSMAVAYDDDVSWPFTWYLRNFENQRYYAANPTRDLRDVPIIIAGASNYAKVEPIVGQAYYQFEYIRMWWPDQDYFNLTGERIRNAITNPKLRAAIFNIWFNRDYTKYAALAGKDMSLPNWSPSNRMRMYVRKDIANQLWNYGIAPAHEEIIADPYEGKEIELAADRVIGIAGSEPGQLNAPRGLAAAPDGSLYVADSRNHRIQHLASDGSVVHTWGTFGDTATDSAPPGTFNEPWDVAIGPDGSVYVADTWNHRVQKFTADGEFITMWGFFGQAESPNALWGPRSVVVDQNGNVHVTDTGNKRIVIFDENGNFRNEFGGAGLSPGQFDEPVGLALDDIGHLFVADTWNQRVQVMVANPNDPTLYSPLKNWGIAGWYGQSLDNKPYMAVSDQGQLFVTDPEQYRILEFTSDGDFVRHWGGFSTGPDGFGLASAIVADPNGGIWVSDGGNNRLLHFTVP